ncbi:MAG: tyrosine-type recombinase/integrase, partial [Planctomycetota bacterium]|nr:tyrosine-type recombinase/integrase [Planctomycetota bacterium]
EILGQFDLIALVELRNDLTDLGRVLPILGEYWDVIYSDWMLDSGGNNERIAYLFDTRAAVFNGLAAEVDAPPLGKLNVTLPAWQTLAPEPGTLLHFYRETYRPDHVAKKADSDRTRFDATVTWLHDYLDKQVLADEVTEETLSGFADNLKSNGHSPAEVTRRLNVLRRILRAHSPQRFSRPQLIELSEAETGTVRHFFEKVYRPQRLIGIEVQEVRAYRMTLRRLQSMAGRDVQLAELSDSLAADFFQHLLDSGLTAATVNHHRARLFAVWRMAEERSLVASRPRVRKLKVTEEEPDSWSQEEASRILDAARSLDRAPIQGIPAGKYWFALLLTCWYTALRRKSLLRIRREDIDLANSWLYLPGSNMKTRRGKRFRLGADALAAVREIWLPERKRLFPFTADPSHLGKQFHAILKAAGVPSNGRRNVCLFHKWRRTVATSAAVNAGMPAAMALLGHSSEEMTRRYVDPTRLAGNDATTYLPELAPLAKADPTCPAGDVGQS